MVEELTMLEVITIEDHLEELHQVSRELSLNEIKSTEIQQLISDVIETAQNFVTKEGWKSAGLAAIQVNKAVRIFVSKNLHTGEYVAYINPKLELLGEASDIHQESCLSIPGVLGEVERHKRIRLSYVDRDGQPKSDKFDGFEARIVQHEYDHLNGILFTEKLVH